MLGSDGRPHIGDPGTLERNIVVNVWVGMCVRSGKAYKAYVLLGIEETVPGVRLSVDSIS